MSGAGIGNGAMRGDRTAKALSLAVIALAALAAANLLPAPAPDDAPPGGRELAALVGTNVDAAAGALAKRRVHRSHDPDEFHYLSPDGCHAHLAIRLVTLGGLVVGWTRSGEETGAPCPTREAAAR